jgi:hypothetical protein
MNLFSHWKHVVSTMLLLSMMLLAACAPLPTSPQATARSGSKDVSMKSMAASVDTAFIRHHDPVVGTAHLTWDQNSHVLTVDVFVTGLAPNSTHPDHIHAGTCTSNPMGPIVYPLNPLIANVYGDGISKTIIRNVQHGILTGGWYVNVHQGPTLSTPREAMPIACGNVSHRKISGKQQMVHLELIKTNENMKI